MKVTDCAVVLAVTVSAVRLRSHVSCETSTLVAATPVVVTVMTDDETLVPPVP